MALRNERLERALDRVSAEVSKRPVESSLAAAAVVTFAVVLKMRRAKKIQMARDSNDFNDTIQGSLSMLSNSDSVLQRDEVKDCIDGYEGLFAGARKATGAITTEESIAKRQSEYQKMINSFYNLVTDFYEWGWGPSFHFAPRVVGEGFMESIKRAEYHLCSRLGMKPGMRVLDVGCGVGGPMRHMCQFSGASIDGITINQYQVNVGNKYNERKGLADLCKLIQGDFQKQPFEDATFDAAYAIEATCHSPDKVQCFSEVARVLKPGCCFAGYEWVVLPGKFDPEDKDHVRIKEGIEVGNGLPTLVYPEDVVAALEAAGFEVLDHYDANREVHSPHQVPWYATLGGSMTLSGFRMTRFGRACTHALVFTLETLRVAPRGSTQVSALLNATAIDLVDGGRRQIFTPSYFFVARKK
ncbi:sterol methyltransferase [Tribonema minus]|uniref:Methyltransferase n=1 Tax=Tribonema minus TaxID=303371 RepID=A0A835YJE1_9STRA|nr:sterol methyltransferase [Tribonema minus]